jgi:hypothetical protein
MEISGEFLFVLLYQANIAFDPEPVANGDSHMASGYNFVINLMQKK